MGGFFRSDCCVFWFCAGNGGVFRSDCCVLWFRAGNGGIFCSDCCVLWFCAGIETFSRPHMHFLLEKQFIPGDFLQQSIFVLAGGVFPGSFSQWRHFLPELRYQQGYFLFRRNFLLKKNVFPGHTVTPEKCHRL